MIWGILILATILRLINTNQSLWLDEAINVLAAKNNSLWNLLTQYSIGDFHPPGWFLILWIWEKIGGSGEIWVRLPAVAFGIVTVWLVYLLGKKLFSKKVGLIAAFLMTLAPLHVYYSQEARMYSLTAFAVAASFYFFLRLIDKSNRGNWLGYVISGSLVLYSDYLAYLILPAQLLYLFFWQRGSLKKVLTAWFISLITLIPWLFIFPLQLAGGFEAALILPGWKNVVGGANLKELLLIPLKTFFGRVSFDNKLIYYLITGLVGVLNSFILWNGLRKLEKPTKLLLCWIIIPVILAFLISLFVPVLTYFRIIFILPAFYLLIAKGIDDLGSFGKLALVGVCLVSLVSLEAYYTNPKFQREDWKNAVPTIESKFKDGAIILLDDNSIFAPYTYYAKDLGKVTIGLKKIPASNLSDVKEIPSNIKEVYLFEYLRDITDPHKLLQQKLTESGFTLLETINFNGVGFVHHFILQY